VLAQDHSENGKGHLRVCQCRRFGALGLEREVYACRDRDQNGCLTGLRYAIVRHVEQWANVMRTARGDPVSNNAVNVQFNLAPYRNFP
jgi:hypothetical protein